jgi:hypothetical protein
MLQDCCAPHFRVHLPRDPPARLQAPLLVLLTHCDARDATLVSTELVIDSLGLEAHPHRRVHVHRCAATTGAGVDEAVKLLCDSIERARRAE